MSVMDFSISRIKCHYSSWKDNNEQQYAHALSFYLFILFFFIYSHPSDLKHRFHRHQSSSSLHGSFNHNHVQDTNLPLVAEEHDEQHDKGPVYDPKQDVFVSLFVRFPGNFIFDICVSLTASFTLLFVLLSMLEPADRAKTSG